LKFLDIAYSFNKGKLFTKTRYYQLHFSIFKALLVGAVLYLNFTEASAQSCSNPSIISLNNSSIAYEVKGESWLEFSPSDSGISIWAKPRNAALPTDVYIRDASCGTTNINAQPFYERDDSIYRFRVFGLIPGKTYYIVFSGLSGSGFELDLVITSISSIGSSCTITDLCGYIANPGFEEEDPNNPITAVPNTLERYIDNACGWGIGSSHPGGATPDYFLAGLEPGLFGLVTSCTNSGPGNSCVSQTAYGNGVAHLFVRDLRTNVNPLRREMIYTELLTPIATGGMYALDAKVRANVDRVFRSTEVQGRLTSGFVPANNPAAPTLASYDEVDFGLDLINTNSGWQSASGLFKATSNFNQLIVGNFKSNGSTPVITGTGTTYQDSIPSVFVDDLNLYFLGDAGKDKAVCLPFSVGTAATCAPLSGVSYAWREPSVSAAVLGTGPVLNVANTSTGIHAYTLTVSYNGESLVDQVNVTTIAPPTFTINNDVACPGSSLSYTIDFGLAKLDPGYSISYPGLTATSPAVINNGVLTLSGTPMSSGPSVIVVTGTQSYNGLTCPFTLTIPFQDCCSNPPSGTVNVTNQSFSSLGINTTQVNTWFLVSGTLTIDRPVVLDHCTLLMMPDARIEVSSNESLDLINGTHVLACDYRWHEIFVDKGARLVLNQSTLESGITGIHMSDGASLQAEESSFRYCQESIFFDNHASGSVDVVGCDFLCGVEGQSPILKAPGSPNTVGHPSQYESGISFVGSDAVIIDGGTSKNYFHLDPSTSIPASREVAFIYVYSSTNLEFYNNKMAYSYAGFIADHSENIRIGAINHGNSINPNLTHPVNFNLMRGIESDHATIVCEYNTVANCTTAVEIFDPTIVALASQGNVIQQNDLKASTGISVIGTHSHGRVRIIGNSIEALRFGVKATSAGDCSTNYLNSLFIADNTIDIIQPLSAPGGSTLPDTVIGIGLQNTNCVQVGSNSINTSQPFIPPGEPSNSNFNHIGIKVKDGQDNRISKPTISNFEFGLLMDDDANSTQFSCLTLKNCNVGIGFKDVGQIVNDVKDFNSLGPPYNSVGVNFQNVTVRTSFIGIISAGSATWNSTASLTEFPGNAVYAYYSLNNLANSSTCFPLPKLKREIDSYCAGILKSTGNTLENNSDEPIVLLITDFIGKQIYQGLIEPKSSIVLSNTSGLMVIYIESTLCRHVEKVYFW
jgi:hypothetical protein